MKKISILFGEMGAGKNHFGTQLAERFGCEFFDGDTVVPSKMIEKVMKFQPLTREMILDYVEGILLPEIVKRTDKNANGLVVAQALYFDVDRWWLLAGLKLQDFDVEFYWVKPPMWRNMQQLFSRPRGHRWVMYYLMNKPYFQEPTHRYKLLDQLSL